jgi:hypothetical protein
MMTAVNPIAQLVSPDGSSNVNFLQAGTGAQVRSVQSKLRDVINIEDFGAISDGVTDCAPAFLAAVNAGHKTILANGQNYYFSAGVVIPSGVSVIGGSLMPSNPPLGTRFTFANGVSVCVTVGGSGAGNGAARLQNVTVTRATGAIPAGSVGVKIKDCYGVAVEDVFSHRHAIGFFCDGDKASAGIAYMFTRCWTGVISDAHVVIDTVPETRWNQCRFGMNGAGDLNCAAFMRVQGGSATNAANGPNSLVVTNCQFNQGQNVASAWLEFVNQTPGSISDIVLWQFDSCYVETITKGIVSDATWSSVQRLQISNCTFNVNLGTGQFLDLNAATSVVRWTIGNNIVFGAMSLAPTPQIDFCHFSNCLFSGAVSTTGPTTGSVLSFADCNFPSGLTLSGQWGELQVKGGSVSGGALTNTATGRVHVDIAPFNSLRTFTPSIAFGGNAVGVTYNAQEGVFRIIGNVLYGQIKIELTNKGSSSGDATVLLTTLPNVSSQNWSIGNSGSSVYATNMSGLGTSPITVVVGLGPVVNLYRHDNTGIVAVNDTIFTNTSIIAFSFSYVIA